MEVPIQDQLVKTINQHFNPLPEVVPTPVNFVELEKELLHFPDKVFARDLIDSFKQGFSIGYDGPQFNHISRNLKSYFTNLQAATENIVVELREKRVAGPFLSPPLNNFRTSPIGIVPKKDSQKVRMITDLSSPKGFSINDYISDNEATVQFNNFDCAVNLVGRLGQGALLSKLDVKSAFRICPVHPDDWNLLGFSCLGYFFVDLCLPFGLRSSVNRFTRMSDSLSWILQNNYGVQHCTHYLDDYLFAGEAHSDTCMVNTLRAIEVFQKLGIPLAPEKIVYPTTQLTFLGIEIDSIKMELRLPEEKFTALMADLSFWPSRKKCTKRELLSLIGRLSFAAKIIPSGRTFLRRLIDASMSVQKLNHHITLNTETKADLEWWLNFLPLWNGKYKILSPNIELAPDMQLYTDASGTLGLGIYFKGKWVSCSWPAHVQALSIQWKELFPIYVACRLWAHIFSGKRMLFHCDNLAVVNIWSSRSSKCPKVMSLLRKLFFISAKFEFTVFVDHIPGTDNSIADSLSRQQVARFRELAPQAEPEPTNIPADYWIL